MNDKNARRDRTRDMSGKNRPSNSRTVDPPDNARETAPDKKRLSNKEVLSSNEERQSANDLTKIRRTEERLQRLIKVLTDSNEAVILIGQDGRILEWNHGASDMYGWSEDEAVQMNIRDLTVNGDAQEIGELTRRLLAGERIVAFETRRRTKDGRILEISLNATIVRDDSKNEVVLATIERDFTQRAMTEAALRRLTAQLQQRTNELETVNQDLTQLNRTMVGRELRMIDLKKEVNELCVKAGLPKKYDVSFADDH